MDTFNLFINLSFCKADFPQMNELRRIDYNLHAIFIVRELRLTHSA